MKQKWTITLILSLYSIILSAQNQEVISTAGNFFENSSGSVSYTIGECIVYAFIGSNLTLTQGYQQVLDSPTDFPDIKGSNFKVTVYPNPVNDFINLKIENNPGLYYTLYDMNGEILDQNEITGTEIRISCENLNPSVYVLKIFNSKMVVKVFKIIKY